MKSRRVATGVLGLGLLLSRCTPTTAQQEAQGGSIAYCPPSSAPAQGAVLCNPIPDGLGAPVSWWTKTNTSYYPAETGCNEYDDDIPISPSVIVLPHDSEYLGDSSSYAYATTTGAWGFGPTFKDLKTGVIFHMNHLKPGWDQLKNTANGTVLLAGSFVGVSGADTCETGYCSGPCIGAGCCSAGNNCTTESGTAAHAVNRNSTGAHLCLVTSGSSVNALFGSDPVPTCQVDDTAFGPIDFDGDGRTDFGQYWPDTGGWSADAHTSDGMSFTMHRFATAQGADLGNGHWVTGDFDGNGMTDFSQYWPDTAGWSADVHLSNGTSFGITRFATAQGGYLGNGHWVLGDFDGNGMTDYAQYWPDTSGWSADAHLSNGTSFGITRFASNQGGYIPNGHWVTGDFNGDGMTDFAQYWPDASGWSCDVHLSTGSSFTIARWATNQGGYIPNGHWVTGDFNGDGMTDFAQYWPDTSGWSCDVHASNGSSFDIERWASNQGGYIPSGHWVVGDFDGDGNADFSQYWPDTSGWSADVHASDGKSFGITRFASNQGGYLGNGTWVSGGSRTCIPAQSSGAPAAVTARSDATMKPLSGTCTTSRTLLWSAACAATSYTIDAERWDGSSWQADPPATATGTSYSLASKHAPGWWAFAVQACGKGGCSPFSTWDEIYLDSTCSGSPPPMPPAPTTGGTDAGSDAASGHDASAGGTGDGGGGIDAGASGCSCRTGGSSSPGAWSLTAVALAVRRRRKRRDS